MKDFIRQLIIICRDHPLIAPSAALLVAFVMKAIPRGIFALLRRMFVAEVVAPHQELWVTYAAKELILEQYGDANMAINLKDVYGSRAHEVSPFTKECRPGTYLLWKHNRPIIATVRVKEGKDVWDRKITESEISLSTLARSTKFLEKVIAEKLTELRIPSAQTVTICVPYSGDSWKEMSDRKKRPVESVMIPSEQMKSLCDDISEFTEDSKWYESLDVPYQRGYLFYGPPGCGKTSLIVALAGKFNKRIYSLSLSTIFNDSMLMELLTKVEDNSIVVIEDCDALGVTQTRTSVKDPLKKKDEKEESKGVSLSGLLNALDGMVPVPGRILMMTTNHIEKLDPALIREGRIDVRVHLDYIKAEQAAAMFERFFPGASQDTATAFGEMLRYTTVSPAAVQGHLLKYRKDEAAALSKIGDLYPNGGEAPTKEDPASKNGVLVH